MKREAISCEAKSRSCTYCATRGFNEADCSLHPQGVPRLFTLRATFKRFIFCVELHLTMLASP
ncbi:MAG: hypothetical protein U9N42_09630, partial [Campylobacterota bacterium]|nr:hypothetical protein [Campylobacterota bacterium]